MPELLTPTIAQQAIGEVFAPLLVGMEVVRPYRWARALSDEHWAMLRIQGWKGGDYSVEYAVSCGWVPHRQGGTWRRHRTLKQARPDLWVDRFTPGGPPQATITSLGGLARLRRDAEAALADVTRHAAPWWRSVDSVEGVLRAARNQSGSTDVQHAPSPEFVAACTLIRLGDLGDAWQLIAAEVDDAADMDALMRLLRTDGSSGGTVTRA